MPIVVDVREEDVDDGDLDRMFEWFHRVDGTFSTYKDASEISRLNRGELSPEQTSPDVRAVLARCEMLRTKTHGYFDARAASADTIDPSGLVKGWSVDRAAAILAEAGLSNYAINAGGDMRLCGGARPAATWRVGIQHPLLHDQVCAVVETQDAAVATSGSYARGDHVLDPHTRRPPTGVLSVTVVGPDLATADAYATAAFAMGRRALHWTARLDGYEALTVLDNATVLSTPRFPHAPRAQPVSYAAVAS